jgi:hypothetical protein
MYFPALKFNPLAFGRIIYRGRLWRIISEYLKTFTCPPSAAQTPKLEELPIFECYSLINREVLAQQLLLH